MANTTFNPSDQSNITLSGGNLIATTSLTGAVRTILSQTSGKFYWETTVDLWAASGSTGPGIANTSATLSTVGNAPTNAAIVYRNGAIWVNNLSSGSTGSTMADGALICFAIDLGGKLLWARQGAAGNWNFNATNNPTTGVGGRDISAITGSAIFGMAAFTTGGGSKQITANFGDSAFTGTPPGGYAAGFPGTAAAAAQARAMVLA